MELIRQGGAFAAYAVSRLHDATFNLVDVGCGGGIDAAWRIFGERLRAVGFDPNVEEVHRLQSIETSPHVRYEAAFVDLPASDPIVLRRGSKGHHGRNPWNELAVARTVELTAQRVAEASNEEKVRLNAWSHTKLAQERHIHLPTYFRQKGPQSIDFLKIDIDGGDFDVLQSLEADLADREVLGVGMEVNFFGSSDSTEHTFHNTDRYLKEQGFELFGLTVRPYSAVALPLRYAISCPGQSIGGRPFQGDALYCRDLGSPRLHDLGIRYGAAKLLKLAVIYSLFGLPDCAAQILNAHQEPLSTILDLAHCRDLLAAETAIGREKGWNYAQIVAAFEADAPEFYTP